MSAQFSHDAQKLYNEIEHQGLSTDVIEEFLAEFAARVEESVMREMEFSALARSQRHDRHHSR